MTTAPRRAPWRLAAIAAALWLAGCAAQQHNGDGMKLLRDGKTAEGLAALRKASELDPNNARYRIDYLAQRELASQAALNRADEARGAGRLDEFGQGSADHQDRIGLDHRAALELLAGRSPAATADYEPDPNLAPPPGIPVHRVFIPGNHDRLYLCDPEVRRLTQQALGITDEPAAAGIFTHHLMMPRYGLLARHAAEHHDLGQ